MTFEEIKLYNPGILLFDIPKSIFDSFQKSVVEKKFDDTTDVKYNNKLAGQIEHEYKLEPPGNLKLFLIEAAKKYQIFFKNAKLNTETNDKIVLQSFWVNYQKKFEYNPIHSHSGILSFIIFVKIPFLLENEDKFSNTVKAKQHANGRLTFTYQTLFNNTFNHNIDIDKDYEGKMIIFPNTAFHSVNPFYTSDDYRITVSGNFNIVRD